MQLSRLLVAAYGERAAMLARGRMPLHDTAFDALQQACAQADGGAGASPCSKHPSEARELQRHFCSSPVRRELALAAISQRGQVYFFTAPCCDLELGGTCRVATP